MRQHKQQRNHCQRKADVPDEQSSSPGPANMDVLGLGKQLSQLYDTMSKVFMEQTTTFVSDQHTITSTTTDRHALPISALVCAAAGGYYGECSSSLAGFSTLARASQLGCLCNAGLNQDFDLAIRKCYDFLAPGNATSTRSEFASFASVIASGTRLCPATSPMSMMGVTSPTSTTAATSPTGMTTATSPTSMTAATEGSEEANPGVSVPAPTSTGGSAGRGCGWWWSLLGSSTILWALL